jgi:O-antigen/teichoic acid export membrane protein
LADETGATLSTETGADAGEQSLGVKLTSGRLLARNTVWNLFGQTAALVVALFTLPFLIQRLGSDRFGVLLLIWMLVGYAGLFDLGVGRALTKMAADKIGADRVNEIPVLFWMSMFLMTVLGLVAGLIAALLTPWLVSILNVPSALVRETQATFFLVALALPIVMSTAGLAGLLEAWQRFDLIAFVNIPLGILQYAGPLLVLPFTSSLVGVMGVILAARVVAWLVRLWMCLRVQPGLRHGYSWQPALFGPLLRFGGWLTLTAVISPLMVTFDRFVVGALTSVKEVTYYATPYEVLSRFLNIPASLAGVLFPAFAVTYTHAPARAASIFGRTARFVFVSMFPLLLFTTAFAPEWLKMWLGPAFAANSSTVVQLMAIGILFNSIGRLGFSFVTGVGKARWTGLLHLAELPLFFGFLYLLTLRFGIVGAALATTLRYTLDTVAMLWMVGILLPEAAGELNKQWLLLGGAFVLLLGMMLPLPLAVRVVAFVAISAGFAWFAWAWVLSAADRHIARDLLARGRAAVATQ